MFGNEERRGGLKFRYLFHGVVPHPDLPAYVRAADWYLLSTIASAAESNTIRGFLPSKMWEYLRGGKPILLFGPRDEGWEIIDQAGTGVYLGELEGEGSLPANRVLDAVRAMKPSAARVQQHSWQSRAQSMEDVFSQVLGAASGQ